MIDELNNFQVTNRQTFIEFLKLMAIDFLENPESWENKSLPDFLQGLSAYTEDIQGYYNNMTLNVDADIFKGAKIYE